MATFDLNSYRTGSWTPQDNNAAPYVSGIAGLSAGPKWLDPAMQAWANGNGDTPKFSGPMPTVSNYGMELVRAPGDGTMQRGTFTLDPATGQLTQTKDWQFDATQDGGFLDKVLPGITTALLAYYGGQGLMAAGGYGAGAGELSGMDLAADATSGGNSIAGAASQLGSGMAGTGIPAYTQPVGYGNNIATLANASPASPFTGGAPNLGATNPALIESATGSTGYGLSSAGAGGAPGVLSGLAPVVTATPIPAAGAGSPPLGLGSALLDLGGAAAGSMTPTSWLQLLTSGYNWMQANDLKDIGAGLDPFGAYRADYARQLAELMANPGKVTERPGYAASMSAAEQALTRNLAAQGLTGSGAAAEALTKFGGEFQDSYYQRELATLAGLSGANFNNAPAALQANIAGSNAQNRILENLVKILPILGGRP